MAHTGVLRPGFIQLRVLDMPSAITHYVDRIGLHQVSEGPDGRIYLKSADEFDHHSVVLRRADSAGMDVMAFKVAKDSDLDRFEKRITDYGYVVDHIPPEEQPGIGRRIGFMLESGHRIELFAHAEQSDPKPLTLNPDVWDYEPHGMRVRRFDHALLYGPNVEKNLDFFCNVLDFSCTETVGPAGNLIAVFLSAGMKAHDIAFANYPSPGKLHHISFELESWNDVGHAADIIARYDISIDIGPTRHGITRGQTIYFFDPSGNRNEVFAGGFTFYPDHPIRTWDEGHVGKAIFYYERVLNDAFLSVVT